MHRKLLLIIIFSMFIIIEPIMAQEKQKFTYDAKGRLIKVEREGGNNNGAVILYEHDKAHNRKRVKVDNAPT